MSREKEETFLKDRLGLWIAQVENGWIVEIKFPLGNENTKRRYVFQKGEEAAAFIKYQIEEAEPEPSGEEKEQAEKLKMAHEAFFMMSTGKKGEEG